MNSYTIEVASKEPAQHARARWTSSMYNIPAWREKLPKSLCKLRKHFDKKTAQDPDLQWRVRRVTDV